ncbi:zinc finger and BTB domain-containing protein 21-like isoform X1 [Brienomyrus brachyistius]|uniref:zinc finger and BTB domain-containing protein 21-like isoform X1 n=2 Tax=Brienomyrus brachyistius TaxID=42636 RepID=UPI0020B2E19A|nr:zinc finger and BTB domain-containing protein 21-like isoform X1 [Brienomyrus brachyistius]
MPCCLCLKSESVSLHFPTGKMDSLVHYINPVHISSLLSVLNEQRLNGRLCDVIIIVGDHKFQAHRSVLAASSEYFQTIFNSGNTQGQSVVQLDFCDPEVFENVLNYIYSSSLFVNKGYLAAVQEMGCSLGIQFLNNIMEKKPQVSYIVSKKKMFSEGNEGSFTSRNVIVGQNHSDNPVNSFSHIEAIHLHGKTPSEHAIRKQTVLPIKESTQLSVTSSVSLIDLQIQHRQLPSDTISLSDNPQLTDCKEANPGKRNQKFRQTDRVGFLFKTPLAKSLSIDNPVCTTLFHLDKRKKIESPEKSPNIEASDQLGDLSDVIQVTVGDDLPVDVRNLTVSFDELNEEDEQRKARLCSESSSLKKPNGVNEHSFSSEGTRPSITADKANNDMQKELKQNRIFKCRNCLMVFRSSTGLCRHINMFHNPEKLYACHICNKRFHTNFKVWTHCQTQHGILQDPAPTTSFYTGMDDRLYRKSAGLVQERELKKRPWGLKSGSLQSQINHKYHLRSRSIINTCPQCGNTYRLLSQFKRHLMLHHCVKSEILNDVKEALPQTDDHELHSQKDENQDVSSCSVCSEKFCAKYEQGEHEQRCQAATGPHCGPFDSFKKKPTEIHCEYKNLSCHKCKRTFQSTFSLWQHQVEVHSQPETRKEPVSVYHQDHNNDAASGMKACGSGENADLDSFKPVIFHPESSSIPKTESLLSLQEEIKVEEEPSKENIDNSCSHGPKTLELEESSQWSCEKCGRHFSGCKQLERHQELLCYIKPFNCHICQKSFRTNFRLWSHIQSHTPNSESASKKRRKDFSSNSPSLPLPSEITESVSVAMGRKTEENAAGELLHSGILCDTLSPSKQSDQVSNHAPAPSSSKRHHICKLCRRNFKTAFSLWSHEQSHSNH